MGQRTKAKRTENVPTLTKAPGQKYCHRTRYRREFADMVYELRLLGLLDEDLARVFGVKSQDSILQWRQRYPDFAERYEAGGALADAKVVRALFSRAVGMTYTTQRAVTLSKGQGVEVVTVTETLPPDVKAQELWLSRRRPELWSEPAADRRTQVAVQVNNPPPDPMQGQDPHEVILESLERIRLNFARGEQPTRLLNAEESKR